MTTYQPTDLANTLGQGLLSFPITHLTPDLAFDEGAYRENISWLGQFPASGLFAAGGTGEFFSLEVPEVERIVRAAVQEAPEGTPILAPAGYGTRTAVELAQSAERVGADGILLFPPYLTEVGQEGLFQHVKAVCDSTSLGVIIYNRGNAIYSEQVVERLTEVCPNLIGFKDGGGDIEQMTRIYTRLGERLLYVGGLPTAEMFALPYLSLGLTTYSSAVFNFLPQFALDFYAAIRAGDNDTVFTALRDFFMPYCDLRNSEPGYAVSIVKAGMKVVGRDAGPVRPPLTDLDDAELAVLADLVKKVS